MTGEQVEKYIREDLGMTPRHNCYSLADAITDMAEELDHDECDLLYLLLENRPIDTLHTHSYTFHTGNGRYIIETLKQKYYEYESAN